MHTFSATTSLLHDMPDWMLRVQALPGGRRQKKREKRWPVYQYSARAESQLYPWGYGHRAVPLLGPVDRRRVYDKKPVFALPECNLRANELKYWSGSRMSTSGFRQCRLCGMQGCMPEIWLRHAGCQPFNNDTKQSCFKILDLAYKLLASSKKCVVCDAHTLWTKWGLPLCHNLKCVELWMYNSHPMPDSLEAAVVEVDRRNLR